MKQTAKEIIARKKEMRAGQARHIERFCNLRKTVNKRVFGFGVPSDCLCQRSEQFPEGWNWQDSGKVMAFIEKAVEEKIARDA
jgi:hypothetical protein